MRIDDEIIKEIRNKNDIVEIINNYVPLTKRGKNYFGVCPFHDDHSPSMSVSPEKQIYTCFSCGATGNVFSFIQDYEHLNFIDAVKLLGSKVGYKLDDVKTTKSNNKEYEIYNLANKFYQNNLYSNLGKNAIFYLNERKIDLETIKKFEIGLSIPKISLTEFLISKEYNLDKLIELGLTNDKANDLFTNRIMFPLYDLAGNVVAFSGRIYNTKDSSKYVNTKETNIFKKGNLLYNYHKAREHLKKNDYVLVMEGFMDVIRASTVGINNCVATMGTAFTKNHATLLKKMTNNVILCFDGDSAGEEATTSALSILEETGINIKIIRLEDNMDPDDYIIKKGKDAFLNKIEHAYNLIDYKMNMLKENKNLTNLVDIAKYLDESIKELSKTNDEVLVELTLKKLALEYNIEYDTLLKKYQQLNTKKKDEVTIKNKKNNNFDKYGQAERYLIYYMLKDNNLILKGENKIIAFPDQNMKYLFNEIIYFYHKYGTIILADFITYLNDKEDLLECLKEIINYEIKDNYKIEEIDDYIKVINEYWEKKKIEKLELSLKEETNPLKQAKILESIMKVKGVKQ